jgi:hypothetical protein
MRCKLRIILLLLMLSVSLLASLRASACAVAVPHTQGGVQIATESAIIIWDSASKTQHFIRRAEFQSDVNDFGFLVPTPTKPTLAEADDEAFKTFEKITEPATVTQKMPSGGGGCMGCIGAAPKAGNVMTEPANVRVLEEKRVAGHDAVVLEADDAKSLNAWLKEHGYSSRPELEEWLEPYVKAGWKITAFKIAKKDDKEKDVATTALRMTFQTEQPFFPYSEPADQRKTAGYTPMRLLRVYFVSDQRMSGALKDSKTPWPGNTVWADEIKPADRTRVLDQLKLPEQTNPASWWLTEFEDRASPRSGTSDVLFSVSETQGKIARPPRVIYVQSALPGCVMCLALATYIGVTCLMRRFR